MIIHSHPDHSDCSGCQQEQSALRTRLAEAETLLREIVAMDDSGDYNGRKIEDIRAFLEGSQEVSQ